MEFLKRFRIPLLSIIVIAALAGVGTYAYQNRTVGYKDCANVNGQSVATTFTYAGKDGKNALELLKSKFPKTSTKTAEGLGEYVTGINCRDAGSTEYWQFLVNGKSSDVGASTYITKSTDVLEWKLTSF
ncbi:MAG: DUF4430 domain-containing protein [bacterium]|nr:DUF4430 domain-containing protein [bacterium]